MSKKTKKQKMKSSLKRRTAPEVHKSEEITKDQKTSSALTYSLTSLPPSIKKKETLMTADEKELFSATKKDILMTVALAIAAITLLVILSFIL